MTITATREHGIIFTAESIRAIIEGRKTQTRRVTPGISGAERQSKRIARPFRLPPLPNQGASAMSSISFFATGIPKGQPRVKATMRGAHASVYDPGTANGWKMQIAIAAREHRPAKPLDCPVRVKLSFDMPRPKSHFSKSKKNFGDTIANAPSWHICKPDCDNLAKAALDELTQLGFWTDDSVISELIVRKEYKSAEAGCLIEIQSLMPTAQKTEMA